MRYLAKALVVIAGEEVEEEGIAKEVEVEAAKHVLEVVVAVSIAIVAQPPMILTEIVTENGVESVAAIGIVEIVKIVVQRKIETDTEITKEITVAAEHVVPLTLTVPTKG